MFKRFTPWLVGLLAAAVLAAPANAQLWTFSTVGNATVVGVPGSPNSPAAAGHWAINNDYGTIVSMAGMTNGTITSGLIPNYDGKGLDCYYSQTSIGGSPSTQFSIQEYDAASGTYETLLKSVAVTSNAVAHNVIYPGMQTTTLPSNFAVLGFHAPTQFALSISNNVAATSITGVIGCAKLN